MSGSAEFNSIFYPNSVAVIGASTDFNKLGYHCMASLMVSQFEGKIYPVHPSLPEIRGLQVYPSIKSVPDKVDLAIICVRSSLVPSILNECAGKGVKGVVLITAGFKEAKTEVGTQLQDQIAAMANRANIRIIGPNTFGIVNLHANLNASFTPEFSLTPKGNISLVSQSGGFCHLIAPLAMEEGVGMSKIIGLGNRCNVDFADMLDYLADDPDTKVIMIYIEGIDGARRMFDVAAEVTRKKPIVALKAGKFGAKDDAAYFHTGSLAGQHEIYIAAFEQAGIIGANSSTELLDIANALAVCPLPKGKKVAVLSSQAGPGITMSDVCEQHGLVISRLCGQTTKRIEELLPPLSMRSNPIDMGPAWYDSEIIKGVIEAVSADDNVDSLLFYTAYASANKPLLKDITTLLQSSVHQKPVVCCFPSPKGIWIEEKRQLVESGVTIYATPERAAKVLVSLVKRSQIVSSLEQP